MPQLMTGKVSAYPESICLSGIAHLCPPLDDPDGAGDAGLLYWLGDLRQTPCPPWVSLPSIQPGEAGRDGLLAPPKLPAATEPVGKLP